MTSSCSTRFGRSGGRERITVCRFLQASLSSDSVCSNCFPSQSHTTVSYYSHELVHETLISYFGSQFHDNRRCVYQCLVSMEILLGSNNIHTFFQHGQFGNDAANIFLVQT